MASPAETLPPAPTQPHDEFDPMVFWIQNRQRILLLLAVVAVAGALSLLFWQLKERSRIQSQQALAGASKAEDYQKVAADYPRSLAGGNALLLLADKQRAEGKLEDSNATLQKFIQGQEKHPLISGAYTSLAANLEMQGKLDDALANYKKVISLYPLSFSAPVAYMAEARVLQAQGKGEEARKTYELVTTQYPDSLFRNEAMSALQKLKK